MNRFFHRSFLTFCCAACGLAAGAEHAVLKNGFRVSAEKIEKQGDLYRLLTRAGVIELACSDVQEIEKDDYVVPVEPPSVTPPLPNPAHSGLGSGLEKKANASIHEMIDHAAMQAGIPAEFVHSVAKAESNYQANAVSHKGAIGVMQLMPATAAALSADPHDPQQNIEAGARYLRDLLMKYDGDSVRALAAYNAGPAAVDRYRGVPPYRETVTYVDRVLRNYARLTASGPSGQPGR